MHCHFLNKLPLTKDFLNKNFDKLLYFCEENLFSRSRNLWRFLRHWAYANSLLHKHKMDAFMTHTIKVFFYIFRHLLKRFNNGPQETTKNALALTGFETIFVICKHVQKVKRCWNEADTLEMCVFFHLDLSNRSNIKHFVVFQSMYSQFLGFSHFQTKSNMRLH